MKLKSTTALSTILGSVLAVGLYATPVQAQATRTWVSGVGDDVNPCSRTAPCKTFAGAISKTFINGEIDVLDPGGFGTINITKSITLDGTSGSGFGSILASGVNGVIINIAAGNVNDPLRTVRLRNLAINGTGASGAVGTRTGINGVRILNAALVILENVVISDFTTNGVRDERTSGKLVIIDGVIRATNTTGVHIGALAGATQLNALLDNVRLPFHVSAGLRADNGAKVDARNIQSFGNQTGFQTTNSAILNLENCAAMNNEFGILNGNFGTGTTRISNCVLMNNTTNVQNSSGSVLSFGNNKADTAITVTAASPGPQ